MPSSPIISGLTFRTWRPARFLAGEAGLAGAPGRADLWAVGGCSRQSSQAWELDKHFVMGQAQLWEAADRPDTRLPSA